MLLKIYIYQSIDHPICVYITPTLRVLWFLKYNTYVINKSKKIV